MKVTVFLEVITVLASFSNHMKMPARCILSTFGHTPGKEESIAL